jgi:hypothetical protein
MRVLEVIAVLEAVAEQTIEADMGEPDQAERDDQRLVLPPPIATTAAGSGVLWPRL